MSKVKIEGNASGTGTLTISAPNTNTDRSLTLPDTAGEFVTADASGNVGIGTTSPDNALHIKADQPIIKLEDNQAGGSYHQLSNSNSDGTLVIYADADGTNSSTANMRFSVGSTERMRIDSSGNAVVGATSFNIANDGHGLGGGGNYAYHTATESTVLFLNRKTSDGDIVRFQKDNTTVGVIGGGFGGNDMYIGTGDVGVRFDDGADSIYPLNTTTKSNRDNAIDLGYSSIRFDDVYATNGTIQTSDQNEKQQIASLTDAEMNVAKRLSALFKTFKWNSSVEENGDNARTHSGIIAQDMQQAFTDEGLDAGNYAMFISSTWWEKEISVDAVEEETDEEGNVITESKDAYTYMDMVYEATEGYTERTRLGVRYPELFAFISAYNDQRFSDLETRIEALENA